jgi:hypothetical protein
MAQFTLMINLGNDGILFASQLSEALRKVAMRIAQNDYDLVKEHIVRGILDVNGNDVGVWIIDPSGTD